MKQSLFKHPLFLIALLVSSVSFGQAIKGTVSDANGGLPGVNITIAGTTSGALSDFDGNYVIEASEGDVLVFSYVGYQTEERTVGSEMVINVTMSEDLTALDEVVVIGYGSTTVKDATGAVAAVRSEDFNQGVISSPEQPIQGKTAGVQISNTSGQPGAGINIRIRGTNSVRSNNNPLFVVDGIPLSGGSTVAGGDVPGVGGNPAKNPLNFLNPNDIESISILKDASATAIYGSRGANGVVIITTKNGRSRDGEFTYQFNVSSSKPRETYNLLSSKKFLSERTRLGLDNSADYGSSTDWQDVIFRTAASHNQNVSYSKSHDTGSYLASVGFGNQLGVVENSNMERISARLNVNQRFLDDKLKISLQGTYSRINDQLAPIAGSAGFRGDLLGAAYSANPTWPNRAGFDETGGLLNPANLLAYSSGRANTNRYLASLSAEYDISDDLRGKVSVGIDQSDSDNYSVSSKNLNSTGSVTGNGRGSYNNLEVENELLEATLNYNKTFGDSKLEALVGFSYQSFRNSGINSSAWGFGTDDMDQMGDDMKSIVNNIANQIPGSFQQFGYAPNLSGVYVNRLFPDVAQEFISPSGSIGAIKSLAVDSYDNTTELQSYFARVNYSYKNKYLLTATVRADGSSSFSKDNRYGYFPSGAIAWKLSEEDFLSDSNVSTLKLRVSAGITGNQEGVGYGNYVRRERWGGLGISDSGEIFLNSGVGAVAFAEPNLKWESTVQYGAGLDFGFNDDRLSGSIDVYSKETQDLLFLINTAQPAVTPTQFKNLEDSKIVNKGVEFGLAYDLVQSEDFNWSASFNVAYNDNMVESLTGEYLSANVNGPGLTGATAQKLQEGYPLFSYFVRVFDGYNADGTPIITEDPQFVGKSALPTVTGGFSTNLSYKRWTMSAYLSGQFGHYVYNNTANAFFTAGAFNTSRNVLPETLTSGEGLGASAEASTRFLEKGDFVRLQNLSFSYNLPLSGKGTFKSMVLSLTGQNLLLFTNYSGLDPEVSSSTGGSLPSIGMDYGAYPNPTTITFGINAKF